MKIVRFNKHKDSEYQVFLKDIDKPICLFDDTIIHFNLLNKKDVTDKEFQEIVEYNNDLLSYYKALKYLGIKMRSKSEIRNYLKRNEFSDNNIAKTIQKLEKAGYLDEKSYIRAYVLDQINLTLNGPLKIKNSLINLELNESLIDAELNNVSNDIWVKKIEKIITKRLKSNKDSEQQFKLKTSKYLFSIGYSKNLFNNILSKIEVEDDRFDKIATNLYLKLKRKYNDDKLYLYLKNKLYIKGYSIDKIEAFIRKIKTQNY